MRNVVLMLFTCLLTGSVLAQGDEPAKKQSRKFQYEEVGFEEMMRRYFQKESSHELEGIYSVSCVITKRSKVFLSKREKFKILERQDNYARVAIVKDWPASKRDFIEISLSYRDGKKYPIVGEIDGVFQGNAFIYKHIEPDGSVISFSMIHESPERIEGEFSKMVRRKTITYKLSYLKTYPKDPAMVMQND